MPRRQRALDLKRVREHPDRLAAQPRPHQLDQLLGQVGDVPDGLVLDLAALPIGAAQQMRDVLPPLPMPSIGDNVNRTSRAWSSRHERTIPPTPDRLIAKLMTTYPTLKKAETPATTRI